MPAALPALTPFGASSKTRQVEGSGLGSKPLAACRKMSGAGLPFTIMSPAHDTTNVQRPQCILHHDNRRLMYTMSLAACSKMSGVALPFTITFPAQHLGV